MNYVSHTGHRQRLRQRFIENGLENFQDHEVLELLLFYCLPRKNTNELAHKIMSEFKSLDYLFESNPQDISRRCGVSENTAVFLSLFAPVARRYSIEKCREKPLLNSSSIAGQYAVSLFIGKQYENFYVICLDAQNRVNYADCVHHGTINEATVYPRLIIESALKYQANSVMLAHNHPGGTLKPSNADIEVTQKIGAALKHISIQVVDHLIVGGNKYFSFAENGLL